MEKRIRTWQPTPAHGSPQDAPAAHTAQPADDEKPAKAPNSAYAVMANK